MTNVELSLVERLKLEIGDDLREQENPGCDDYAKAFNEGIRHARRTAFVTIDRELAALSTLSPARMRGDSHA